MTQGVDEISQRKIDHLRAFEEDPGVERKGSGFDAIRLTHRALPETDLDAVDTSATFLGKSLSFPLIISSMTGGSGNEIQVINHRLAEAAEATGVAMAVGSQRVMLNKLSARTSFDLRPVAPTVPLVANIGAVQLNNGVGASDCLSAIDVLGADGLYLHLNPLQEAVQPEGDRNFAGLVEAITALVPELPVPVLLKEVGAGLSPADIVQGLGTGVRHFDVAGRGGTSWSRVEYHRRAEAEDDLGLVFQDWGLTTVEALQSAVPVLEKSPDPTTLIASGGIRNGMDMAKAMILGADMCGIAAPFLPAAKVSTKAVINKIEQTQREFKTAMFLLGCSTCTFLKGNQSLLL
ncbi:MAG: type 2 isopentenyl-diphosphate Delta-isomerase [Pseudomonadota bacterium]